MGLGVLPDVCAIAHTAALGTQAAFPASEVAVLVPKAGLTLEAGNLRADSIDHPVGKIGFIQRIVKRLRPACQLAQIPAEVVEHFQRI